ncbi:VirK/YbjX family protein [Citrobacter koseri]|uniref:VirK/YbjX family protein n=1 Tax=Citrobacter koseri TaxID=545 RepID=UPI003D054C45
MQSINTVKLITLLVQGQWLKHKRWTETKFRLKFFSRCLCHPFVTIKYFQGLCSLENAKCLIETHPLLPTKLQRPYLYKGLRISKRVDCIIEHYMFLQNTKSVRAKKILLSGETTRLALLRGKNGELIEILCGPCEFDREGEITLTFLFNGQMLAMLSFAFIKYRNKNVAFIAGLQGPKKGTGTGPVREATRACYGIFPKRILYESSCVLIEKFSIESVFAVGENSHVYKESRYLKHKQNSFVASYSEFWKSINGLEIDNVYMLPLITERKEIESIPSKKRSEYRNRYKMLDTLNEMISEKLN